MCTQKEHEDAEHTHAPSQCIHYDCYSCSRCGNCYACDHTAINATPERERIAGARFWWRCPDGFEKPTFMDVGQFGRLKGVLSPEGIDWSFYAR